LIAIALLGAGRIWINFSTGLAVAVVSAIIGYWAIPVFGTQGAAWGQVAGSLAGLVIQLIASKRALGSANA
jgi:O-antigen/teichoic acid export membrane protein